MLYVAIEDTIYNIDELDESEQAQEHMRDAGITQVAVMYTPCTLDDVVENGDFDGYPNGTILYAE